MPWTPSIPEPTHAPADDVVNMQQNNDQIQTSFSIDHYPLADPSYDGLHKQIHLPVATAQGAQVDPASVIYSAAGSASSVVDARYKNQNGIFPLSCIRAFGTCPNSGAGAVALSNSFNVASANSTAGVVTITLTSGVITGTNYLVIASTTQASSGSSPDQLSITYTIVNATQFTMKTVNVVNNVVVNTTAVSFVVIQI